MEKVVLRRRGTVFHREQRWQLAGRLLSLAGVAGLPLVLMGWPPVFLGLSLVAIPVGMLFPFPALTADRDGISFGFGPDRENTTIGWDTVTRIVVEGRGGVVTVAVRALREGAEPRTGGRRLLDRIPLVTGRRGGDRPFAIVEEATVTGLSAAEVADRIRGVTSVPISWSDETGGPSYGVRASLRPVVPLGILAAAWVGGIGSFMVVAAAHDHPVAVISVALAGVGAALTLADHLNPGWALAVTGSGLGFDGEFLAWDEIDAIGVGAGQSDTELLVRLAPGAPAAGVASEARRLLRHVRVDPARLAAAVPPGVRTEAIAPV